jgi:cobalt-zinc-cadmium efflux system membrane fusion protein
MKKTRERLLAAAWRKISQLWHIAAIVTVSLLYASACDSREDDGPKQMQIGGENDWCVGHGLPESKCTKCNPELIGAFKAAGDWCAEHEFPESACPLCNPAGEGPGHTPGEERRDGEEILIEGRRVVFRSPDLEQASGIEIYPAKASRSVTTVNCTARIEFDQDRVADIRAAVDGIVRRIPIELGDQVKPGTPLFELESVRIGEIQSELASSKERVRVAKSNLDRHRTLVDADATSKRDLELVEQEYAAARSVERAAKASLRTAGKTSARTGRFVIESPIEGIVVRRPAVIGALAAETESLATIADPSIMWALCDVPERDAHRVGIGQKVEVVIDGMEGEPFSGEISWIASEVEPRTRTVSARAEIPNPEGRLRAHQFARATIETSKASSVLSVPRSAVQRIGEESVLFVRVSNGTYEPKKVQLIGRLPGGDMVRVSGDLKAEDPVVVTGAFLLKTELMPGSIGAGCCEVEIPGGK